MTDLTLICSSEKTNPTPRRDAQPGRRQTGNTNSRVFRLLDPEMFHAWFLGFMGQFVQACQGVFAPDDQTLHRSYDRAEGISPPRLVSAWPLIPAAKERGQ